MVLNRIARKTNTLFVVLIVALVAFSSCKGARNAAHTEDEKAGTAEFVMKKLVQNQVRATGMEAKAKISFDDGDMSQSATATIKWKKDEVIWMSVTKFGFEVARAQITPDSIYLIDRINNEYAIKDLSFIHREYNLPANFQTLQALLMGSPVFFNTKMIGLASQGNMYQLTDKSSTITGEYWIDNKQFLLNKMVFEDTQEKQKLNIDLKDYRQLSDNQNFSYLRNIEVYSPKAGSVKIGVEFSKTELTPPNSIRFEIPQRYTRIN